jgi:uracil-DNA glycosylase
MFLKQLMPIEWQFYLAAVVNEPFFKELSDFVESAYQNTRCYPAKENMFKIFDLLKIQEIKVVILGQDPYHGAGQAQGLSFSVPSDIKLPPSLINIYKEMSKSSGQMIPYSGDLHYLANQGVFLLNAILTVEEGKPGSHQNKGWEIFTNEVISQISAQNSHVVFLLWGNFAQKKTKWIDAKRHLILTAGHPSPMSANQGKWFGNNHFEMTNAYLIKNHKNPINWLNKFFN